MKRPLLLPVALLAACGGDDGGAYYVDESPPVDEPPGPQVGVRATVGGGWITITDPETERTFRCLSGYDNSGYSAAGGPFLWCYEPAPPRINVSVGELD
ncbi:MAG: hypothetical protein K0Q89_21 [Thermomicrobiales bacterium]|nr:hypothetical protein [Thermomicrobiales bacterium]